MTVLHTCLCLTGLVLWIIQESSALVLSNVTELLQHNAETEPALRRFPQADSVPRSNRRKRYISQRDRMGILEYHNWVRSQAFPPAANMEYMVWDDRLAKSAEAWASQCVWDHGPPSLMRYIGQNLSIQSGRHRSIVDLVKSWYDEGRYYSFPHPRECNPRCPNKCSGTVCSHYTQMVWAASNRIGCAIHTCNNMNGWGASRRRTTILVCNYSIKGNWIGEAPYRSGKPCSACPPSYGGSCSNNMCFPGVISNKLFFN